MNRPIPPGRLADITNRHHGRSDPLVRELLAEIVGLRATVYRQAEYTGRLQNGIASLRNEIAKATRAIATEIKKEQEKANATDQANDG